MRSVPRNFAFALLVAVACAALSAAVFVGSLALLPAPRQVADALLQRGAAPAAVRVDSTIADARGH